jgi:hypothetical protein
MDISILRYLKRTITLAEFEIRKILHDQTQVWIRIIQPALWLLIFGEAFTKLKSIPRQLYLPAVHDAGCSGSISDVRSNLLRHHSNMGT